jgi:hypothetical protein
MPKKKKDDTSHLHVPNYESLTTLEQVEEEIEKRKQNLVGKDILEYRMKEDKKDYVAAVNEQLKELKEEREHEINVLSALEQHKQVLANQGGTVIPMPPRASNGN